MSHPEVIILYVSYRVSDEKEKSDGSFATLYLLKDNNNGHSVVTSGKQAPRHWQSFWSTEFPTWPKTQFTSINFPINRSITWWLRLRESLEITRCGGIFMLSSPKKTLKSSPQSHVAFRGTPVSCSGSAPPSPWITDGTCLYTWPLRSRGRSGKIL